MESVKKEQQEYVRIYANTEVLRRCLNELDSLLQASVDLPDSLVDRLVSLTLNENVDGLVEMEDAVKTGAGELTIKLLPGKELVSIIAAVRACQPGGVIHEDSPAKVNVCTSTLAETNGGDNPGSAGPVAPVHSVEKAE